MKKYLIAISVLLCAALTACSQKEPTLVGVQFERGSGSTWGNQLYIDVRPDEISMVCFIPKDSADLVSSEHISIADEQWQTLTETVQSLELKEVRQSWKEKLFGSKKLDGGDYRNLTLLWETEKGTEERCYEWPQNEQANMLEALLEQLAEMAQ